MDNGTEPIQDRLQRAFLECSRQVDGSQKVNLQAFARGSPFELPSHGALTEEYADRDLATLRALHEHSKEAKRTYFDRLQSFAQGYLDAPDDQIEKWWRQFCLIIIRSEAVEHFLTAATIQGPDGAEDLLHEDLAMQSDGHPAKRADTVQEIAAKIRKVFNRSPSRWPESTNKLLLEVDKMRGKEERTTYRYLHEKMGDDKPKSLSAWREWAEKNV